MTLSKGQLLTIASGYWRSTPPSQSERETSPEAMRRQALWELELEDTRRWKAFLGSLSKELPEFTIGSVVERTDASLRCIISPPNRLLSADSHWIVVGCVSILAPVYVIYGVECDELDGKLCNPRVSFEPPPARMSLAAQVMAGKIEATFGVSAMPLEIAATPVPLFVELKAPPQTTLFHALFTSRPDTLFT